MKSDVRSAEIFGEHRVQVKCDNQSAICAARNQAYSPRSKHLDIRYHFGKDVLERVIVELYYVNTKDQPADGFTKPLMTQKQDHLKKLIGLTA